MDDKKPVELTTGETNDLLRSVGLPSKVVLWEKILEAVTTFEFPVDGKDHAFGIVEVNGEKYFFKVIITIRDLSGANVDCVLKIDLAG